MKGIKSNNLLTSYSVFMSVGSNVFIYIHTKFSRIYTVNSRTSYLWNDNHFIRNQYITYFITFREQVSEYQSNEAVVCVLCDFSRIFTRACYSRQVSVDIILFVVCSFPIMLIRLRIPFLCITYESKIRCRCF
jgi:hypothetical protein